MRGGSARVSRNSVQTANLLNVTVRAKAEEAVCPLTPSPHVSNTPGGFCLRARVCGALEDHDGRGAHRIPDGGCRWRAAAGSGPDKCARLLALSLLDTQVSVTLPSCTFPETQVKKRHGFPRGQGWHLATLMAWTRWAKGGRSPKGQRPRSSCPASSSPHPSFSLFPQPCGSDQ